MSLLYLGQAVNSASKTFNSYQGRNRHVPLCSYATLPSHLCQHHQPSANPAPLCRCRGNQSLSCSPVYQNESSILPDCLGKTEPCAVHHLQKTRQEKSLLVLILFTFSFVKQQVCQLIHTGLYTCGLVFIHSGC